MEPDRESANRKIFVVHGRNQGAADSMFQFLRALGLDPLEWDQAVALTGKGSPYVGEVLDVLFEHGQAVVVLMTPDDVAYIHGDYSAGNSDPELTPMGQARPNVLFEAGMAMGRNSDKTILVELGDIRPFSDVAGRHLIRLDNSPQKRTSLATRLATAGLPVNRDGSQWLTVGDFTPPNPGGSLPQGKRVPSSDRRGPSIDAKWLSRGGNKIDRVVFTNGPVELYDVTVDVPEDVVGVQLYEHVPVSKLPAFKTFSINGTSPANFWNQEGSEQFELDVRARLEDGSLFSQSVYIDSSR